MTIIKSLYYITHINNLPSILDRGILSHSQVEETNVDFTPIYDNQIVNKRQEKYTPDKSSLWQYANLYFQPRNPMMYRVIKEKGYKNLAVVAIKPSVMDSEKAMITDGNVANDPTKFFPVKDGMKILRQQWSIIKSVNLQGVMGKGLASRAKYQFPDVYVDYQDACRKKQITETKPYLYRREGSLDLELADTTEPMAVSNAVKWFLLFATKRDWRDSSRPEDIKAGLEWIRDNYVQL